MEFGNALSFWQADFGGYGRRHETEKRFVNF
jgi:hypothetical protein